MFDPAKVAQMAAYFLLKQGGRMPYIKLMKLMYLADRESMRVHGETISGDRMVAMPRGPVLSSTLDLLKGQIWSPVFQQWVTRTEDPYEVAVTRQCGREDLDELHMFDTEIMDGINAEFGHMGKWDLVQFTHDRCAEWSDPHGSSRVIEPEEIFVALGFDQAVAREKARDLAEREAHSVAMARYR